MTGIRLTLVAGMATLGVLGAAAPAAISSPNPIPHHTGFGKIRVKIIHNYGADHAKGRKICALATTTKRDKILGKCDIANARGIAVLRHVPAGACNIGAYEGFQEPWARAKHRVHVSAGNTTKFTWHFNEVGVG